MPENQENPKAEEIKEAQEDVKKYALLEAVARSEGGQMLIKAMQSDCIGALDKILLSYKTAPDIELRTWCAVIGERIGLLRAFGRAPKQHAGAANVLAELLKSVAGDGEDSG